MLLIQKVRLIISLFILEIRRQVENVGGSRFVTQRLAFDALQSDIEMLQLASVIAQHEYHAVAMPSG